MTINAVRKKVAEDGDSARSFSPRYHNGLGQSLVIAATTIILCSNSWRMNILTPRAI